VSDLALGEIPDLIVQSIASWRRTVGEAKPDAVRDVLRNAAGDLLRTRQVSKTFHPETDAIVGQEVFDSLAEMADLAGIAPDDAQQIMVEAARAAKSVQAPAHNSANGSVTLPKPVTPAVLKTPAGWPAEAPPLVDWLAFQRIPRGDVTTLHGDGGAGKTDIALRLAANVARGAPDWLGHEIAQGPVVLISAEEPEREIWRRTWLHGQRDGYTPADLANLFQWFPDNAAPDTALATPDRHGIMRPTRLFDSIGVAIHQVQPVLVVVDNVAATFAGNQNDRVMVRTYVNLWRAIARIDSSPAVLLIDHPSLSGLISGTGRGGNMDWRNAVRSALYLRLPEDKAEADRGIRILETQKSNYGPPGNPIRLQWADGGLEREQAPTSLHRLAKDAECEQIFLRLLDERNAQGSHVGRKISGMYAPKEFAAAPNNGGYTKQAFAAAMQRLFTGGAIREVFDARRRHDYIDRAEPAPAMAAE
jgi:RecA-family ATPase